MKPRLLFFFCSLWVVLFQDIHHCQCELFPEWNLKLDIWTHPERTHRQTDKPWTVSSSTLNVDVPSHSNTSWALRYSEERRPAKNSVDIRLNGKSEKQERHVNMTTISLSSRTKWCVAVSPNTTRHRFLSHLYPISYPCIVRMKMFVFPEGTPAASRSSDAVSPWSPQTLIPHSLLPSFPYEDDDSVPSLTPP